MVQPQHLNVFQTSSLNVFSLGTSDVIILLFHKWWEQSIWVTLLNYPKILWGMNYAHFTNETKSSEMVTWCQGYRAKTRQGGSKYVLSQSPCLSPIPCCNHCMILCLTDDRKKLLWILNQMNCFTGCRIC